MFSINQIINQDQYTPAAIWCNSNGYKIEKLEESKNKNIVEKQFIIKEIEFSENDNNNVNPDSTLNAVRKYFILDFSKQINNINTIANPYTAPCDGVVDCKTSNGGGWFNMEVLVNGKTYYQNYSGGNYGDEEESKHTRVPVHKGDLIQMVSGGGSWVSCYYHLIPYKY